MADMKRHYKILNEQGLTLIEVLASVVLLMIILTISFNIFIQSSKINHTSKEIVDATYLAQTELEIIYEVSMKTDYGEREIALSALSYNASGYADQWIVFHKDLASGYYIKLRLQRDPIENSNQMNRMILTVHKDSAPENHLVSMENIVVWGADEE